MPSETTIVCDFKVRPPMNRAAEAWNETVKVGDPVCLHRDNGEIVRTKTISEASEIGGSAVCWFEGISGRYDVRCAHALNAPSGKQNAHAK